MPSKKLLLVASSVSLLTGVASASAQSCINNSNVPRPDLDDSISTHNNWRLTFSDDFSGENINPDCWKYGGKNDSATSWAGYEEDNISLVARSGQNNQHLRFTYEKKDTRFGPLRDLSNDADDEPGLYPWASGAISTFDKFRQRYGYFEARIRFDQVPGIWPAFWLMPHRTENEDTDADYNLELDRYSLIEFIGAPTINGQTQFGMVSLSVFVDDGSGCVPSGGGDRSALSVFGVEEAWSSGSARWNAPQTSSAVPLDSAYGFVESKNPNERGVPTRTYVTVDVTDFVNARRRDGAGAVSFALKDVFSSACSIEFGGPEHAHPPVLTRWKRRPSDPSEFNDGSNTIPRVATIAGRAAIVARENQGQHAYGSTTYPTTLSVSGGWGDDTGLGFLQTFPEANGRCSPRQLRDRKGLEFDILEAWGANNRALFPNDPDRPELHTIINAVHTQYEVEVTDPAHCLRTARDPNFVGNGVRPTERGDPDDENRGFRTNQWHTYGMYWDADQIEFFVDGNRVNYFDDSSIPGRIRDESTHAYILLTGQAGPSYNVPTNALDGERMEIDYVRAWTGTKPKPNIDPSGDQEPGGKPPGGPSLPGNGNTGDCDNPRTPELEFCAEE